MTKNGYSNEGDIGWKCDSKLLFVILHWFNCMDAL